jgi:hypothetical protein
VTVAKCSISAKTRCDLVARILPLFLIPTGIPPAATSTVALFI